MAATEVSQAPPSGVMRSGGGTGAVQLASKFSPQQQSQINFFRIATVMDQLSHYTQTQLGPDVSEFLGLCLSLSRGIDFAIGNQEVPNRARELPSLIKQVYQQHKNDSRLQADIMVLMISVKNACRCGWFSDKDSTELLNMFNEIASLFCSVPDFNTDPNSASSVISTIMSRFFPRLKMGHILVFLEVKPGFEAYVMDFQIAKNLKSAQGEKIRFFVVQTDNVDTSSCLISPPKVSFLLNGKGVDLRTNVSMDTGPQVPTVVRNLLKYGANLLQAVGDFNGNFIIAVALMSNVSGPDISVLQDYEQHASAIVDSDAELIEGPSRVSLNCPISKKRCKTPVKGYLCKHIQCFDFDNYVDINSRRPHWRCPHCNQPVCFTDIRIDQKMVEILKEVGPEVNDIIFSSDGSWSTAMEIDDPTKKQVEDKNKNSGENSTQIQNDAPLQDNILDLTETDDITDSFIIQEPQDRKVKLTTSQSQSIIPNMSAANSHAASASNANPNGPPAEGDSWSRMYLSTFGTSSVQSQMNYVRPPSVLVDSMAYAPHEASLVTTTSAPQNEMSSPNAVQMQHYQYYGNAVATNEYGRFPSQAQLSRNVTRVASSVQGLAAPGQATLHQPPQQRVRYQGSNPYVQSSLPAGSQPPPVSTMVNNSTSRTTSTHAPPHISSSQMSAPWLQQQNVGQQQAPNNSQYVYSRTVPDRHILPMPSRMPPHLMNQLPVTNNRLPSQPMVQSPSSVQPAGTFSRSHSTTPVSNLHGTHTIPAGNSPRSHPSTPVGTQYSSQVSAANRTAQMSVDGTHTSAAGSFSRSHVTIPAQQPPTRIDPYEPDPNWRPAGRMRGALTGQDYTNALNQFISRPNQQAQAQAVRPAQTSPNFTPAGPSTRPPAIN